MTQEHLGAKNNWEWKRGSWGERAATWHTGSLWLCAEPADSTSIYPVNFSVFWEEISILLKGKLRQRKRKWVTQGHSIWWPSCYGTSLKNLDIPVETMCYTSDLVLCLNWWGFSSHFLHRVKLLYKPVEIRGWQNVYIMSLLLFTPDSFQHL